MADPFLVARNPTPGSRLAYLVRLPVPGAPIVLAAREPWPASKDVFCYEIEAWPEDAEILESVPVTSCQRRGQSVDLVLQRAQRRRSLFVWTRKGERTFIFWRSQRSMRASRPGVRVPQARGLEGPLVVAVDRRERYAWRFADKRVTIERRALPAGDYAVFDGNDASARLVGAVERKRALELAGDAVAGKLALTLAELSALPRAVVIVEGKLSHLLKPDVPASPGWLLNLVAGLQAAYPNVPILFAESAKLAADLAYRWLSACQRLDRATREGASLAEALAWDAAAGERAREAMPGDGAPLQSPLFDPPAIRRGTPVVRGDAPLSRAARQRLALERARAGETWTLGTYAECYGVGKPTASGDLWELVARGELRALGNKRSLRFVLWVEEADEGASAG